MKKEPAISSGLPPSRHSPSNSQATQLDLSVIIISLNEAASLPILLSSLPPGCEIIVLDSGSSDNTREIAQSYGAQVFSRPFDNYASQKNAAAAYATRSWILSVDCDEELTSELKDFVIRTVQNPSQPRIYRVRRQLVFQNRRMRFGRTVDWPSRLFPRGSAAFVGAVHESLEALQPIASGTAAGSLHHYSYKDLSDYVAKLNNLTSRVAAKHAAKGSPPPSFLRTSLRPFAEFIVRYVFKLGFLDGRQGFTYAYLSSTYAFMKMAKRVELAASKEFKSQ